MGAQFNQERYDHCCERSGKDRRNLKPIEKIDRKAHVINYPYQPLSYYSSDAILDKQDEIIDRLTALESIKE